MKTPVLAVISIAISVAAQFCLKHGLSSGTSVPTEMNSGFARGWIAVLANPYVISGFLLYGVGALVWLSVLSKWDISKAYPMVGLGFVFALVIDALSGDTVTAWRVVGVILVSIGVIFIAKT